MPGPLQVIAVSFGTGGDFQGRVLGEVDRLQGRGVLRLLDLIFVAKNEDGTIERLAVGDDEDFGALLASILPLDGAGLAGRSVGDGSSGFDPADAWALAESLLPGTSLAFLLIEHGWAQPLFDAIAETGGALLGEGFLTPETGLLVGAEVAAMEEAARGDCGSAGRRSPRNAPGHGGRVPKQPRRSRLGSDSRRRRGWRDPSADHRRPHGGGGRPRSP